MDLYEKTLQIETIFKGEIISLEKMVVKLPNGNIASREIVRHPGATVIVPITDDGYVIMVKQFRKPIEQVTLEMPAGKLDIGEDPLECARRELEEETGYSAEKMELVFSFYSTPGFCDEKMYVYVATKLKAGECKPDQDEFVSVEKVKINQLIKMIYEGNAITDAKSIIGAFVALKYTGGF